jgi:formate hydrogenlyase transcriptional activator
MATSMHEPDWDQMSELQDRRVGARPVRREVIHAEPRFDGILGHSAALTAVLTQLELVAPTDATVLLQGETGTGKEPLARALHHRSPRRPHPFVPVNCAALPPDLLESELFGHEKGAFTGALTQRLGRFELANRGTLFLDEIGDLPLELQPKLLRVLQDHAFERLGSSRTLRTNARVVAATHRDLLAMVQQHTFRADLYYRLNIFPLTVPPLREQRDDIPLLVWHFAQQYAHTMHKRIAHIPAEAIAALVHYDWPGNVRELQHVIKPAVILSAHGVLCLQVPARSPEARSAAPVAPQSETLGPRAVGWQRHRRRVQRGAFLRGCGSPLLLRRHAPNAQSDRRQSHHGLQCLCVTRLLSVQVERKQITKGCAVEFQDRRQAYELAGNSIHT